MTLKAAHASAVKRGARYFGYQMVGVVLANAAALAATALIHFHSSTEVVTVGGWLAASVAAAMKRAYSYAETGTPPPDEAAVTLPTPTGSQS